MIKRIILTIIALILIFTGSAILAYSEKIDIDIKTENNEINVIEKHMGDFSKGKIISFWIQSGHSNVVFTINDSVITPSVNNNNYYFNITEYDITSEDFIQITYNLDKYTNKFEKILQYNTDLLTINLDENKVYSGKNLSAGSYFMVALQNQVPAEIVENIPFWIYTIIIILVILLIILLISSKRKQKTKIENIGGSEEFLTTKKALLMEILKEIEKRHRSKQISDDTYNKLKDKYKQDAVEAMKNLEDLKK